MLWKSLFPGFWITCAGIGIFLALFQSRKNPAVMIFALLWVVASGYLIWFGRHLKYVSIDENFLYVTNSATEVQIPLSHIEKVSENFLGRPKLITLTLTQPSQFGEKIVFVPENLMFAAFRSHPVVEEIQSLVEAKRQGLR
jgi:hypothetical protein